MLLYYSGEEWWSLSYLNKKNITTKHVNNYYLKIIIMRLFSVFIFFFAGSRFQSSTGDFILSFSGTVEGVVAGRGDKLSFSPKPGKWLK